MSYHVYTIDGYGICNDWEDCETTRDRIEKLLDTTCELEERFHNSFGFEYSVEEVENEYESDSGYMGLFGLLCDAINEDSDIKFCVCDDFDGAYYILYTPTYPWNLGADEKRITEEDIKRFLWKYTTILFGHPFKVDYYRCENGG